VGSQSKLETLESKQRNQQEMYPGVKLREEGGGKKKIQKRLDSGTNGKTQIIVKGKVGHSQKKPGLPIRSEVKGKKTCQDQEGKTEKRKELAPWPFDGNSP